MTTIADVRTVPARDICDKHNIRQRLNLDHDFIESVRAQGILQRTQVNEGPCEHGKPFVMVAGHRRLGAAVKAHGPDTPIPVEVTPQERELDLVSMLVENLQRADLDPLDEGHAYAELVELGWSQADVAASVGKSSGHVSQRISLLQLTPDARKLLTEGKLTLADAVALAKVDEPKVIAEVVKSVHTDKHLWRGVAGEIAHQRERIAEAKATAAKLDELVSQGWTAGKAQPKGGGAVVTLKGKGRTSYSARETFDLDLTPAQFRAEPGSYAQVDGTAVVYWTTQPERYRKGGDAAVKASKHTDRSVPSYKPPERLPEDVIAPVREARDAFVAGFWKSKGVTNERVMRLLIPMLQDTLAHNAHHLTDILGVDTEAEVRKALGGMKNAHVLKLYVTYELSRAAFLRGFESHVHPPQVLLNAGYSPTDLERADEAKAVEEAEAAWTDAIGYAHEQHSGQPYYEELVAELSRLRNAGANAPDDVDIDELADDLSDDAGPDDEEEVGEQEAVAS